MKIAAAGILNSGEHGGPRAVSIYPTVTSLEGGKLLATYVVGAGKDSEDNTIEVRTSQDNGNSWSNPEAPFSTTLQGRRGSLLAAYVTAIRSTRLLAVAAWVDRQAFPGKPLFNSETQGILPMKVLLADSDDSGQTWTPWRVLAMPCELGPPAVTGPLLRLLSGRLILSLENGKEYADSSNWYQKVWFCYSKDEGKTWTAPVPTCQDPTGRIFNWDQRAGVAPDGRLVTLTWTYDQVAKRYLHIYRRISHDEGTTWTDPEDLGIADQPAHPAILSDGRVVLAWVDRFGTQTIKARLANSIDASFLPETEITLYEHARKGQRDGVYKDTGELLSELSLWTFGHPYAEALPNGEVIVVFYAGSNACLNTHWVRLSL